MAVLEWDKVGDRVYQSGIDRGVLYLKDGTVVPWNGLTSVEDNTSQELKSYYLDGIKILDHVVSGDFEGKISAITYPDEFEQVLGIEEIAPGLSFHEQESKSFNLAYRTKISNDLNEDHGYKIHLLYNLRALPDGHAYQTLSDQPAASEFSWSLSGTPTVLTMESVTPLMRPTAHISISSIDADPILLQILENILYGTTSNAPRFPSLLEVRILFGEIGGLYIIDNGNGTWTAVDPSDDYIQMLNSETFEIDHADATYIDANTYQISDTPIPLP